MQSCANIRGAHQQPVMWSTDNQPQSTDSNSTIKCSWLENAGYGYDGSESSLGFGDDSSGGSLGWKGSPP